jgi:PAS domain S-box-containing protein
VSSTLARNHGRVLVLIVDDDEGMRLLVRETVEAFGFRALEVSNGSEALAAWERDRPDLVLLDVVMPEMDGFQTCEALRSRIGSAPTPIVMMTSLDDMDSIDRAYEAGATDFITKPINYVLLGHRLRYILRGKQTVDELRNAERRLANAQRIASLGSWEIDLAARSLQVSDELYRILAMDPCAFRGRPEHLWSAVHPEDRARVVRRFERAIDRREPLRIDYRISGVQGERIIHQEAEIAHDAERSRALLVGTAQDITERRRAEQKLVHLSLLSDTVKVVAGSADFESLVEQVASRVRSTLGADLVAVFDWPHDEGPRRILPEHPREKEMPTSEAQLALVEKARRSATVVESTGRERVAYAIPMSIREATIGCLFFEGSSDSLTADETDIVFLQSLAQQLAVALDRARLSDEHRRRQEREKQRLKEEIAELRQASGQVELVHRSRGMRQMLETIERVASTDATILVTGESGTGKELVAHTLHWLSGRRNKPLVVVDCAALPTTLIESELFGHEKGAYTGAQGRKIGRLAEANGGTVVLDEIGELPLEVQSKILRFVQEKQISPVGGTRTLHVDARVIAMTNRDLAAEITARRFREDLYHRLNVIRIKVPSLRDRREDIPLLANHFLKSFAEQYQKPPLRFSPEAEAAISRHSWTGNVRELRNRVLQAVILAENDRIGPELIELDSSGDRSTVAPPADGTHQETEPAGPKAGPIRPPCATEIWDGLRSSLHGELERILDVPGAATHPLGQWVTQDLVLEAHAAAGGALSRAAAILGIPEATYRRKYRKVEGERESGLWRTTSWIRVRTHLQELVRLGGSVDGDRTRMARDVLLAEVLQLFPENAVEGAAVMGVSPPTFRRWMRRVLRREPSLDAPPTR